MSDVEDLDFTIKGREKQLLIKFLMEGNLDGIKYFVEDYCVLKDNLINLNKNWKKMSKYIDYVDQRFNNIEKHVDNVEKHLDHVEQHVKWIDDM